MFFKKKYLILLNLPLNKMVDIRKISAHFYKNRIICLEFIKQHEIIIDYEFKRSPKILKNLIKIRASVEGIELSVDSMAKLIQMRLNY